MTIQNSISQRDRQVMWHPFTQHGLESEFLPVVAAKGAYLQLEDGRLILDAISSWWVTLHGHSHPEITQAITRQCQTMDQVIFAGFTHEPAVVLAETLIAATNHAGATLGRCFYSDNGSTAVEAALKIACQYHKNVKTSGRTRFLALTNAYHGDTIGCMSVSDPSGFAGTFQELFFPVDFINVGDIQGFKNCLQQHPDQHAAFIIEPMVQGVAGMLMHDAEFLQEIAAICKKHGILLICDEVFTGFYRTGQCFAFEHAGLQPDLLCLGKGLTGGSLTLSAVLTTEEVFAAFCGQEIGQAFLHGHSFTANPISCAAALASLQILKQDKTQQAIQRIGRQTKAWITKLSRHPRCRAARSLGTIGAVEIRDFPNYFGNLGPRIRAFALQQRVSLRTLGAVLYAVPPYCVTEEEVDRIYQVMTMILDKEDWQPAASAEPKLALAE